MINRLLWTTLVLGACFDPDLTQKACIDDRGCPEGYFCVAGKCAQTAGGDMSVDPRPKRTEIEVRESSSFYMRTMLNDGFNDRPSYLRSVPGPYFLDEREVTVAEYRACVDAKVCEKPVTGAYGTQGWICTFGVDGKEQHPVTCVSKSQAEAFCTWIGRRLPTEVEWEFAALGKNGADTINQRLPYPDAIGNSACWNKNGTCPVASYVKTYLGKIVNGDQPGFYDLLGNAWEKTASPFCTYPAETCTTNQFTVRGGSGFDSDDKVSKATSRLGSISTDYYPNIGFRCARTAT